MLSCSVECCCDAIGVISDIRQVIYVKLCSFFELTPAVSLCLMWCTRAGSYYNRPDLFTGWMGIVVWQYSSQMIGWKHSLPKWPIMYRTNKHPFYGCLIQNNPGKPLFSQRRDLLEQHWIFMNNTRFLWARCPSCHSTLSGLVVFCFTDMVSAPHVYQQCESTEGSLLCIMWDVKFYSLTQITFEFKFLWNHMSHYRHQEGHLGKLRHFILQPGSEWC